MGKRALFVCAVAASGFLVAAGCGDKKSKEAVRTAPAAGETAVKEFKAATWEGDEYECGHGNGECRDDKMPGDGVYYNGTVFNTYITKDANIRSLPSTKGAVLGQVRQDTKAQILGISKDGWAHVTTREAVPRRGWIYGNYFVPGDTAKSADLSITGFKLMAADSSTAELTGLYKAGGEDKIMTLLAFKEKGQNFFTFLYDIYVENSHYTVIPGLYTWQPSNNRVQHRAFLTRVPYAAEDAMALWNWAALTDNFEFYSVSGGQDTLTFRTSDGQRVFPIVNAPKEIWTAKVGVDGDEAAVARAVAITFQSDGSFIYRENQGDIAGESWEGIAGTAGKWRTEGNKITMTFSDGQTITAPYSVTDDVLKFEIGDNYDERLIVGTFVKERWADN